MRCQSISAAGIAIATTVLLPHEAFAQTSQKPAPAAVPAAMAPAGSVTQILPISYSLAAASSAVSSPAEQPTSDRQQQTQQREQPEQSQQSQQQREQVYRPGSANWHGMQRDAMRWEMGYWALSAVDAAQTISCLHAHTCTEGNPIYGRHPSAARIVLTKLAGGAIQFLMVRKMIKDNPWEARLTAQLSAGIQGIVVGINLSGLLKHN